MPFNWKSFFLQVLAETQDMEFNLDPVEEINPGQSRVHTVTVSPGASLVTFVVVWKEANANLSFTLKDPNNQVVAADVTKRHDHYQIAGKANPTGGA